MSGKGKAVAALVMVGVVGGAVGVEQAGAQVGVPRVLYSNIAAETSAQVPGAGGILFQSFDRPLRSQRGDRWILLARAVTGDTTNDAMYLTGQGTAATLRVREGVTEIEPGRVAENTSERRCAVDEAGNFALTLNLTGATTDDSMVVRGTDAGVLTVTHREGGGVTGIPGASYGVTLADVNITSAGLAFRTASLVGTTSTTNAALLLADGATVAARNGAAGPIPTGQIGTDAWSSFDVGSFWTSAAGDSWVARGSLSGAAAQNVVLAVDNVVRIQESVVLPGQASGVRTILASNMSGDGTWFARGENADDSAWIVRDGVVAFDSDDAVPGGDAGETFSNVPWNVTNGNTFFEHTGNNRGDWIAGGLTNNADAARNGVWVLNGSRVVLRRGDGVDLNGDGAIDAGWTLDLAGLNGASLNNKVTGGFLTDDGWFYFIADLALNGAAGAGEALLRVRVFCPADVNRDGGQSVQDIFDYLASYFGGVAAGDFNLDGAVSVQDIFDFLASYFAGCV